MARNVRLSPSDRIYIGVAVSLVSALLLPLAVLLSFDISLNRSEQGFLFLQLPLQHQLLLVILTDFAVFCNLKLLQRLLMRSLSYIIIGLQLISIFWYHIELLTMPVLIVD